MPSLSAVAEFHGLDPHHCRRCGALARTERAHVIDRAFGGLDDVQNLTPLCVRCHRDQPVWVPGEERAALLWLDHADYLAYLAQCVGILVDEAGLDSTEPGVVREGTVAAGLHRRDYPATEPSPSRARGAR